MKRAALFTMILLALSFVLPAGAQYTGVAPTSTPGLNVRHPLTTDPSILYPPNRDFRILPGDLLTVSVYGITPGYSDVERVSMDGTIRLPLAGVVRVEGYSLKDAEAELSRFFEERQVFHNAQVSIVVMEAPSHVATLAGAIRKDVPIIGQMPLLDVLSAGGGLPEVASTVIQINRPGVPEPIYVDLGNDPSKSTAANIPIFSGDIITTGLVGGFYVVGAVLTPGVRPLDGSRPTTVLQAIAAAGGTTGVAKRDDARLVRTVGNTRSVIPLRLGDIQKGKAPDPVLQADDIILVPTSALKAALRISNATSIISMAVALTAILR